MNPQHVLRQLEALEKLKAWIKKGSHVGAGLHVQVTIGDPESSIAKSVSLSILDGTDTLKALEKEMSETLYFSKIGAKSFAEECNKLVEAIDAAGVDAFSVSPDTNKAENK